MYLRIFMLVAGALLIAFLLVCLRGFHRTTHERVTSWSGYLFREAEKLQTNTPASRIPEKGKKAGTESADTSG